MHSLVTKSLILSIDHSIPKPYSSGASSISQVTVLCPYDGTINSTNTLLNDQSVHLIKKFHSLCLATSESLKMSSMSPNDIRSRLISEVLPPTSQVMWQQIPEFRNVDEIMQYVTKCCSFMTFKMLESVILTTGLDQEHLCQYKEDLCKYSQMYVLQSRLEIGKISDEGHVEMHVKLTSSYQKCKIAELLDKVHMLQDALKFSFIIKLCRMEFNFHQRYLLTFQLPFHVLQHIFPLSTECKSRLTTLGVETLWLNQHFKMITNGMSKQNNLVLYGLNFVTMYLNFFEEYFKDYNKFYLSFL